ncbi:MAG: hypothetical protein ACYC1C_16535 [Chloroflexota bacterium]
MAEEILGIIPNVRKPKSFGRSDTYTLIVTDQRSVFALLTSQMLQAAAREAQEQGKAAGQGFFARMGAQMAGHFTYHERYRGMAPEAVLAENNANFALDHAAVRTVKVKRTSRSDDSRPDETEVKFEAASGNLSLKLDRHDPALLDVLRNAYGDRVKG